MDGTAGSDTMDGTAGSDTESSGIGSSSATGVQSGGDEGGEGRNAGDPI